MTGKAPPEIRPDVLAQSRVERAETIPASWYTDPAFDARDAESIFATAWQCVGDTADLGETGQHITAEVAGNPIVVVRDEAGELRGFYNVCRHRAGPLATCAGRGKVLKCRYHGWTYRLDGSLRGVPHWDRVELFDREDYGLVPVAVDTWEGLLFVSLAADPPPAPSTALAGVAERIAPIDLGAMKFASEVVYRAACNWKVYIDNYLEGYHVPHVHPELFKLYDFQNYRTELLAGGSLQHTPLNAEDNIYATGEDGGTAFYYWFWPNFMLNILPGRVQTNLVVPDGPGACRIVFRYYYSDVASPRARRLMADDLSYADAIQEEDIDICRRVQRGLASRAYDRGRYSVAFEAGVHQFHEMLKATYRDG